MKFSVLCVSLLLLCTPLTPLRADPRDWGAEVSGLKMRISLDDICDSGSTTPAFRVELLNSGESDFVLNLSLMRSALTSSKRPLTEPPLRISQSRVCRTGREPSFRTSCDLRFRNSSFARLPEDGGMSKPIVSFDVDDTLVRTAGTCAYPLSPWWTESGPFMRAE
jgi:hypothetical protein